MASEDYGEVSSTISDTEDDEQEVNGRHDEEEGELEYNYGVDASKIRLRSPRPGSKIEQLKNTIESQVRRNSC